MNEDYIYFLLTQFVEANNIKNIDTNSEKFIQEFLDWIPARQNIGKKYANLLEDLNIDYRLDNVAEVGKGCYDSIVLPFDTKLITPYQEDLFVEEGRIIGTNFGVIKDEPYMINNKGMVRVDESVQKLMTQNPYTKYNLTDWENMHNSGKRGILVGVYGSEYDSDAHSKIKQLEILKSKLLEPYIEEFTTIGDSYLYVISTKEQEKVKHYVHTKKNSNSFDD